ncbi:MAG: glycoside hydrolase family 2 protein, partial [Acutalibacteraceae bacterium]
PLENVKIAELSISTLKNKYNLSKIGIRAVISVSGSAVNEKTYLFKPEKDLVLPKAEIKLEKSVVGENIVVEVSSDGYARLVRLQSDISTLPFSDNYFDLLPGEIKTVKMPIDGKFTADEQIKSITVKSANNIESKASRLYDLKERIRVFLQPVNFAQWVYYCAIPKDLKIE